jgi:hypothetical protein
VASAYIYAYPLIPVKLGRSGSRSACLGKNLGRNKAHVVPSRAMTTRRTILQSAVALVPALAVVACATNGQRPQTADSKQVGGTRHSSGLLVVTRDSLDRHPTDGIKTVVGFCDNLSGLFPDEFGFAYGVRDVAVLGIATDSGQDLYDKWRSDRGLPADARPDPEGKFISALNDQAREMAGKPIQLERVGRSRAQVEALQHSIAMQDPAFAEAKVGMTHVDQYRYAGSRLRRSEGRHDPRGPPDLLGHHPYGDTDRQGSGAVGAALRHRAHRGSP